MSDLIERADAIQVTRDTDYIGLYVGDVKKVTDEVVKRLKAIPAADPKVGKWISVSSFEAFGGDEIYWEIRGNPMAFHYCSACKEQAYVDEFGNEILSKYCPECGAKMKGEYNGI